MAPTTSILLTLALVLGVVIAAYVVGSTEGGDTARPLDRPDPDLPEAPDVDADDRPDGGDGDVDRDYWRRQHRDGTGGGDE